MNALLHDYAGVLGRAVASLIVLVAMVYGNNEIIVRRMLVHLLLCLGRGGGWRSRKIIERLASRPLSASTTRTLSMICFHPNDDVDQKTTTIGNGNNDNTNQYGRGGAERVVADESGSSCSVMAVVPPATIQTLGSDRHQQQQQQHQ
jgi:hypothetical protein